MAARWPLLLFAVLTPLHRSAEGWSGDLIHVEAGESGGWQPQPQQGKHQRTTVIEHDEHDGDDCQLRSSLRCSPHRGRPEAGNSGLRLGPLCLDRPAVRARGDERAQSGE